MQHAGAQTLGADLSEAATAENTREVQALLATAAEMGVGAFFLVAKHSLLAELETFEKTRAFLVGSCWLSLGFR